MVSAINNLPDFTSRLPNPERVLYWLAIIVLGYGVYSLSLRLSALPEEDEGDFEEEDDASEDDLLQEVLSQKDTREDDENDDDEKNDQHDESSNTFS